MISAATLRNNRRLASGALIGLVYGIFIRYGSKAFPNSSAFAVMSLAFVVLTPLAMGFVTIFLAERKQPQKISVWLLVPWIPVLAGEATALLALWEGLICIVFFTPIALLASSLGGVSAGPIVRYGMRRSANVSAACVLCLPLVVGIFEERFLAQKQVRQVESTIEIQARPEVVWRNIERVPRISPAELSNSWSHAIGFPNPIEATLSYEGVGGIRHATFDGGILFTETIDVWDPQHLLGFSIRANADQIPPTTLDEHVVVGGRFFDVLYGEYVLEPLPRDRTELILLSRHRVSTDFNWYAHLWTDAVMRDLQMRILLVVKHRSENASVTEATQPK
jgi:hypothetical protein